MRGQRIILIRHCESSGQAPEAPLTARGHAQARELVDRLTGLGIDAIVSSPYLRARQSIEPFAHRCGLAVRVDERLVEKALAPEPIDDWRAAVSQSFSDPHWKLPGGESGAEAQGRGREAIEAVLSEGYGLAAVVTHGQLLSLVLRSIDPCFGFEEWARLSNPDGYYIDLVGDGGLCFRRW